MLFRSAVLLFDEVVPQTVAWLRMIGAVSYAKLVGAVGLLAVFAFGDGLSALWVMALATLVLAALCALETLEPA